MAINGIVLRKLQALDETLHDLRSLGQVTTQELQDDWRTQRAIERSLQILVEIVIDVCQRLLAVLGQTPAATSGEAIEACIRLGILRDDEAYRQMIRFRNFIVHRYEQIDITILVVMVNRHLTDFDQFRQDVLAYVHN